MQGLRGSVRSVALGSKGKHIVAGRTKTRINSLLPGKAETPNKRWYIPLGQLATISGATRFGERMRTRLRVVPPLTVASSSSCPNTEKSTPSENICRTYSCWQITFNAVVLLTPPIPYILSADAACEFSARAQCSTASRRRASAEVHVLVLSRVSKSIKTITTVDKSSGLSKLFGYGLRQESAQLLFHRVVMLVYHHAHLEVPLKKY